MSPISAHASPTNGLPGGHCPVRPRHVQRRLQGTTKIDPREPHEARVGAGGGDAVLDLDLAEGGAQGPLGRGVDGAGVEEAAEAG